MSVLYLESFSQGLKRAIAARPLCPIGPGKGSQKGAKMSFLATLNAVSAVSDVLEKKRCQIRIQRPKISLISKETKTPDTVLRIIWVNPLKMMKMGPTPK